jgi:hypothetical protein
MMHPSRALLLTAGLLSLAPLAAAQAPGDTQPAGEHVAPDPGWPRQYTNGTATLMLYQPQVDSWPEFKHATGRFAASLTAAKGAKPSYGVVTFECDTIADMDTRTVGIPNFKVTDIHYPGAKNDAESQSLVDLTKKLLPAYPSTVSLDRLLAYVESGEVKPRQTAVSLDPPPILVSTQPAILVIIDGKPVLVDIAGTDLQKVVNTNWDLFVEKKSGAYYLRNDKVWLSAKNLQDTWLPVTKPPKEFSKLPDTEEYKEIKQTAASNQKSATIILVLVADKPSELIVLNGEPQFQPIEGTKLMWVVNTECDLFFDTTSNTFYYLTSGRWFRASVLKSNQWSAATTTLPEDFKKIPPEHPRAHVLASVPGTRQAEEAMIAASIPKTATVDRTSAKAEVQYIGEPKFEAIEGTSVSYAINTPNDVLQVGDQYYLCLDGVWFVSDSPKGMWKLAEKIPDEIGKIPPTSEKYNVTYVTVVDSTPTSVTYGYTDGYTGVYIGFGVAMWGTGYYYPPYYGYGFYPYPVYWPVPYYTYGASAWYNPVTGAYARGSAVYGPYGGYGRAAAYNPRTGSYSWGQAAWGPYGAAASGGFYNPSTGRWGGTARASNGYQSWGRSVVGSGNQWARTASYSDSRGTVAAAQGSGGGKAIAARGGGNQGFVARSGSGDVYAGKDGNVYRRDTSGQWYRNSGGSWDSVNRPGAGNAGNSAAMQSLNRDAAARNWGNYNTQRSNAARQSGGGGGWSSGGFVGNRSSGVQMRSPGFGRR